VEGPPVPPPAQPRPPEARPDELTPEEARERRQNRWLVILTLLVLLAVGAAAYAIFQVEDAKDDNREGSREVNTLRADVEVLRDQLTERLDTVEGRLDDTADDATLRRLSRDLGALDRRVEDLEQPGGAGGDNLAQRVDDLEQRVDDLEQESN
jgi:TolA-binding protein